MPIKIFHLKTRVVIFFTILFLSLLIAPAVISLTNSSQDISFFIDISEEEENKGKDESKIDSELKIQPSTTTTYFLSNDFQINKNIRFLSKNYVSEYLKITTPPPKFVL